MKRSAPKHSLLKTLATATALIAGSFALPAAADAVYRCSDGSTVTYQWTSCAPDQQEKVVLNTALQADAAAAGSAAATEASAESANAGPKIVRTSWRAQVRSPAPYVGISDDAVLNMRGWGRPNKIVRKRGNQAWLEHWAYVSASGETRHLHFSNGKLLAINVEPAPYIVQLANAPVVAVAAAAGQGSSQ